MPPRGSEGLPLPGGRRIPEHELRVQRVRSGGPGGQNVNKTATKVVLRFAPGASSAFDAVERELLLARLAERLTSKGEVVIHANEHRSAEQNLEAARARLAAMLRAALIRPKVRRPTRPPRAAGLRRLEGKRRRSDVKRGRRGPEAD